MNIFTFQKNRGSALVYALLVIAIAVVAYLIVTTDEEKELPEEEISTEDWQIFASADYNFEIRYPNNWEVMTFPNDEIAPKFNFYKKSDEDELEFPLIHHSEGTHLSIFPEGVPTEGVFGETTASTSISLPDLSVNQSMDFILEDDTVWASYINLSDGPKSWQEPGFIWAQVEIENLKTTCLRDGEEVGPNQCDPLFGDQILRNGEVSEDDRAIQEAMIKSFRFLEDETDSELDDLIKLDSPQEGSVISSPLTITGEARGTWYFEASFPIVLTDWDGRIIAESFVEAQDNWMTEDFVPFEGEIEFESPVFPDADDDHFSRNGSLILQKANPSGLPENDAALEIPIRFE